MVQNTSTAVMQQRQNAGDDDDDFPTPLWATRALCEKIALDRAHAVWEPAAGAGYMARALEEYAFFVHATTLARFGLWTWGDDFLAQEAERPFDWIITNPPFRLAEAFACKALATAPNVALLVRSAFLEGGGRYDRLYRWRPPTRVLQYVERVPMVKGRLLRSATTATSYCWLVWNAGAPRRPLEWIEPCRARLERHGDYEDD